MILVDPPAPARNVDFSVFALASGKSKSKSKSKIMVFISKFGVE